MRFAYLISIRNVRRPGATNGPYRVASKGRGFLKSPQTALSAVRGKAIAISSRDGHIFNKIFLSLNILAMARAPIAALWVGGILQRRSDAYKAKLSIFATLVGLRHTPLSTELVRTLGTRLSQSGTDGSKPVSSSAESVSAMDRGRWRPKARLLRRSVDGLGREKGWVESAELLLSLEPVVANSVECIRQIKLMRLSTAVAIHVSPVIDHKSIERIPKLLRKTRRCRDFRASSRLVLQAQHCGAVPRRHVEHVARMRRHCQLNGVEVSFRSPLG
jgi:Family of unknown function (DUF6680)